MDESVKIDFRQGLASQAGTTYVNLQRLGRGGTAETYLVLATSGPARRGQLFALKVFRRLSKPEWLANFLAEIAFLRGCNHPAIMRVFDEGVYLNDHPFVVAEYLPQTLAGVLRTASVVEKLSYALQLLSALEYLATPELSVVHGTSNRRTSLSRAELACSGISG
jgi:serine/threonine protein kinase